MCKHVLNCMQYIIMYIDMYVDSYMSSICWKYQRVQNPQQYWEISYLDYDPYSLLLGTYSLLFEEIIVSKMEQRERGKTRKKKKELERKQTIWRDFTG